MSIYENHANVPSNFYMLGVLRRMQAWHITWHLTKTIYINTYNLQHGRMWNNWTGNSTSCHEECDGEDQIDNVAIHIRKHVSDMHWMKWKIHTLISTVLSLRMIYVKYKTRIESHSQLIRILNIWLTVKGSKFYGEVTRNGITSRRKPNPLNAMWIEP